MFTKVVLSNLFMLIYFMSSNYMSHEETEREMGGGGEWECACVCLCVFMCVMFTFLNRTLSKKRWFLLVFRRNINLLIWHFQSIKRNVILLCFYHDPHSMSQMILFLLLLLLLVWLLNFYTPQSPLKHISRVKFLKQQETDMRQKSWVCCV